MSTFCIVVKIVRLLPPNFPVISRLSMFYITVTNNYLQFEKISSIHNFIYRS